MENVYSVNLFELVFHVNIPPRIALLHYPMINHRTHNPLIFFWPNQNFCMLRNLWWYIFAPCKGARSLESGKSSTVESGIGEVLARGILKPGLWNPEYSSRNPESHLWLAYPESKFHVTKNPQSSTWEPESHSMDSRIQHYLDQLRFLGNSPPNTPPLSQHFAPSEK